jgi:rhodanese-related sulfurtransferase
VVTARPPGARGIDEILAAARGRLRRITPHEAFRDQADGAVLIDIRPAAQRAEQGEIPGSVIVERNHLEWRLDPGCDARLPWVAGYDHRLIVFCVEGYTSSLAAAALHDLGLRRATDVIGGFRAWSAAGLPTAAAGAGTVTLAPGASAAVLSCSPPGALDAPFGLNGGA